jgi:hypothetical protein
MGRVSNTAASRIALAYDVITEARLKVRPSMFPRHIDRGFHIVCQDNEF